MSLPAVGVLCVGIVCGDSRIDLPKTCDDGNAAGGDGCSATCEREDGWTCSPNGRVHPSSRSQVALIHRRRQRCRHRKSRAGRFASHHGRSPAKRTDWRAGCPFEVHVAVAGTSVSRCGFHRHRPQSDRAPGHHSPWIRRQPLHRFRRQRCRRHLQCLVPPVQPLPALPPESARTGEPCSSRQAARTSKRDKAPPPPSRTEHTPHAFILVAGPDGAPEMPGNPPLGQIAAPACRTFSHPRAPSLAEPRLASLLGAKAQHHRNGDDDMSANANQGSPSGAHLTHARDEKNVRSEVRRGRRSPKSPNSQSWRGRAPEAAIAKQAVPTSNSSCENRNRDDDAARRSIGLR